MVHPNGFLEEEDITAEEAMEGGSETGGAPSVSDSLLDFGEMEVETGSQQSRGGEDQLDDLFHVSLRAPASAASLLSR